MTALPLRGPAITKPPLVPEFTSQTGRAHLAASWVPQACREPQGWLPMGTAAEGTVFPLPFLKPCHNLPLLSPVSLTDSTN